MSARKGLEVHEHSFIGGPRAGRVGNTWPLERSSTLRHSHEGGDVPHKHPDAGPASYTIDKDEWARLTGMKGGGRKRFTAKPTGDQLPVTELEEWQKQPFEVHIIGDGGASVSGGSTGPGIALPLRIATTFRTTFKVIDGGRGVA